MFILFRIVRGPNVVASIHQFEGFGCTAKQYCAAMTIDSLMVNQNTGIANTSACNNFLHGFGHVR